LPPQIETHPGNKIVNRGLGRWLIWIFVWHIGNLERCRHHRATTLKIFARHLHPPLKNYISITGSQHLHNLDTTSPTHLLPKIKTSPPMRYKFSVIGPPHLDHCDTIFPYTIP
jgi:hypothetical protein